MTPSPHPAEAQERLAAYIERRKRSRGLDIDSIHGFDVGPDCGVELKLSDIEAVLIASHAPAAASGEAVTLSEDGIGASLYRGNTVSFMYQKAKNYGDTVQRMWKTLADAGFNNDPSGNNHVEDMLRAALAKANPAAGAEPCNHTNTSWGNGIHVCKDCREILGASEPAAPTMRERLQKQCSDWGTYWRASDAHGVELTKPQAVELLQDALGVEVEIKDNGCIVCDGTGKIGDVQCPDCSKANPAAGAEPDVMDCEDCGGTGEVGDEIPRGEFQPPERERCTSCDGSGKWHTVPPATSERDAEDALVLRGVISALGALAWHSKHGDTLHDEIVNAAGKQALYLAAEPEDVEWAGLDPIYYASLDAQREQSEKRSGEDDK